MEAFDISNIDCGIDINTGIQQLVHFLISLFMPAARSVGAGQLIEQDQSIGRTPLEAAELSIGTLKKVGLK